MPKYIVRHGVMRNLGVFSAGRDVFPRGAAVITRTNRGMESGEILCEATEEAVAQLQAPKNGQILRAQSADDRVAIRKLREHTGEEFEVVKTKIAEQQLDMRLVDVEHLFGGERIVVYYIAENRVDFRELVKILARELQTRIEMRQIGVRDEAKLLADYGDCGKPVCCNTHLSEMPPVSMKMAKLQKATLDPSKISGRCGRLKCCLRYEYDTYLDLQKEMPPIGSDIITSQGRAKVLGQELLAGQLLIETEEMRRMSIDAAEVLTILKRGSGERIRKRERRRPTSGSSRKEEPQQTRAGSSANADAPAAGTGTPGTGTPGTGTPGTGTPDKDSAANPIPPTEPNSKIENQGSHQQSPADSDSREGKDPPSR